MFSILTNVLKAGVAVAASPVALVADIVTLPSTALDGRPAFGRTGKMLDAAGDCISAAVAPGCGGECNQGRKPCTCRAK